MRRSVVVVLAAIEALVACAIFACALELSRTIDRDETMGTVAAAVVRSTQTLADSTRHLAASTRRLAETGVQLRITIGNA